MTLIIRRPIKLRLETYALGPVVNTRFRRVPTVQHAPKFNTSVQHNRANPFQPPKSLSSTPKKNCVELRDFWCWTEECVEQRGVLNSGFWCLTEGCVELRGFRCWTEGCVDLRGFSCWTVGCVELRGFWCWTERFWGLKRCGPCVELRGLCGTDGYSFQARWELIRFSFLG